MVRHAAARSAFYGRLYESRDLSGDIRLADLPVINKTSVMENFDDLVVDRRLRLKELNAHLGTLTRDEYYLGEYRALITAGTTGRRGIFVFDRAAWRHVLADALRWQAFMGLWPTWPRSLRFCTIDAPGPAHVSARMTAASNVGLFRFLRLRAIQPLSELTSALNAFQPDVLIAYPSLVALLAAEQLNGDLDIAPRTISTHGELLTPKMAETIERAWHKKPFNHYGLTELPHVAIECCEHEGLHLLSDQAIVEVVNDAYQPVMPGEPGTRLLVTNLRNRVQPLIRYEVSDLLTISPKPCSCGRPFPLLERIEGRSGDIINLPGRDGGTVSVPPIMLLNLIDGDTDLRESRVSYRDGCLRLEVVPETGIDRQAVSARLSQTYGDFFDRLKARRPEIDVQCCSSLDRTAAHMGKIARIESGHAVKEQGQKPSC